MRRLGPRPRLGFTLVELLTVIAIIGVLVAILVVGVIPMLGRGYEFQTNSDIRQLASAVNIFKGKHNNNLPPSRITLSANVGKIDPVSLAYLNAIWPRLGWQDPSVRLDWAGTGQSRSTLMNIAYTLEGEECLVFFLGGIPDQHVPGCHGFSSNPVNPTDLAAGAKESYFNFESSRLFKRAGSSFYSYADPWATGKPYVYFSSGKHKNGYNPSDSSLIPGGPYFEAGTNPPRYFESTGFQIISAGKNGVFGRGGAWSPATAALTPTAGADDQTNFYDAKLGVPK